MPPYCMTEREIMQSTHSHPPLGSDLNLWNVVLVTSSIDRLPFFREVLPTDHVAERYQKWVIESNGESES